jgi:hypothetical protein
MKKKLLLIIKIFLILSFNKSFAEISLEAGSYVNRSQIDSLRGKVNLNFTYRGCDPNPSSDKIKLSISNECRDVESYKLKSNGSQTAVSGKVGEIIASYDEPLKTCSENKKTTRRLYTNQSFVKLYEEFQKRNCFPSHIVLRDGTAAFHRRIAKNLRDRTLCNIPLTRIIKKNFPTEDHDFFKMKANDNGFKIGEDSNYRFDHDQKLWCVKYKENPEKCGHWPSPLPIAYKDDTGDKKYHLKGTVSLSPTGEASVRAIDKEYSSEAALFNAQKNNEFLQTDKSKGRIDFNTWRNDQNGLIRTVVKTFSKDDQTSHERTLNFFARNVLGFAAGKSWCSLEHCFIEPPDNALLKQKRCVNGAESKPNSACFNNCAEEPQMDMNNGGNGNACFSCVGITPGQCALKKDDIAALKSNLTENENFSINSTSGEYNLTENVESGIASIYTQLLSRPRNPGCYKGESPDYHEIFEPSATPERSINSNNKNL